LNSICEVLLEPGLLTISLQTDNISQQTQCFNQVQAQMFTVFWRIKRKFQQMAYSRDHYLRRGQQLEMVLV